MVTPAMRERRAGSASRVPPHAGHAVKVTARSTKARMCGCIASTSLLSIDFWMRGTSPSYVMLMPATLTLVGSL